MALRISAKKAAPALVTGVVLAVVYAIQLLVHSFPANPLARSVQRLESMSYDWRVQAALRHPLALATNLGAVFLDEGTGELLSGDGLAEGGTGAVYRASYPYPRHLYGRMIRELTAQGAKAVGFDIMFANRLKEVAKSVQIFIPRADAQKLGLTEAQLSQLGTAPFGSPDRPVPGVIIDSDDYFAAQLRQASNCVLAADTTEEVIPLDLFRTNALSSADISVRKDADGYLRSISPFTDVRVWDPLIRQRVSDEGLALPEGRVLNDQLVFRELGKQGRPDKEVRIRITHDGYFDPEDLAGARPIGPNTHLRRVFTTQRFWHLGIVLGARAMNLDLARAAIDAAHHRIVLKSPDGLERIIPLTPDGRMLIDWSLTWNDTHLVQTSLGVLLSLDCLRHSDNPADHAVYLDALRAEGRTNLVGDAPFRNRIVVVGSIMAGSNLRDMGPTPLSPETVYVSCHWNVANSLITGQFVHKSGFLMEGLLILLLGIASGWLTNQLRPLWASFCVIFLGALVVACATLLYIHFRYWLPIVLPVLGALLMTHVCMVTHRVLVEQQERRRVRSVFARLVSPDVVSELLDAEQLALGGARRKITVYFADVRGFTEMTDISQAKAEEYVRENKLAAEAAEHYYDVQAREVLSTVNLYLSLIADLVKKHSGTLDKYIGDCVMAFWGAPTPNEKHALDCVRAAIDAQRAIDELNRQRATENLRREQENLAPANTNRPPLPMLSLLSLGTGINTGVVTIGLMGSDAHILNYTAFGREVNLASRLEGVSGRGRIIISEATFSELQRDDPVLAATCVEQPAATVKGFRKPVRIYEVPWKLSSTPLSLEPPARGSDQPAVPA
jgi:class 3 adenylate cyclase